MMYIYYHMHWLFGRMHQSWLVVALCIGVIIGAVLENMLRWNFFASPLWILLVVILCGCAYMCPNRLFWVAMVIAGVILVGVRASGDLAGEDYLRQFIGREVVVSGVVVGDPDVDENEMAVKLTNLKVNEEEAGGAIYVQISGIRDAQRSDVLVLRGKLVEGFGNYSAVMYRPKVENIARPEPGDVFLEMRNWLAERVRKNVPETESALGLAYLMGMKNGLSDDVLEILRLVGLTHIVVASGTHLGIIVECVRKIFGKLSKFAGMLFAILFILIFGGLIGWTASITRAVIVVILTLVMKYVGREFEAWRILLIAMAITLMINPMFLTDLGWLLSFGSFGGIMLISPIVKEMLFGDKEPGKISEIIITTISAQILCIPVMLYYFGTISLISVVANLLILPTIPFAMGAVFLTGILEFVPFLGAILGKITTLLLDYHLLVMRFFAEQKMFLIEIEPENPWVFLLFLPVIGLFLVFFIKKKRLERQKWEGVSTEAVMKIS